MVEIARRWWRDHGRGEFTDQVPEEVVGEMLRQLWERRDALEAMVHDVTFEGDRSWVLKELASLDQALGLQATDGVIRTGDPLVDYWISRHLSGELTPEDLDLQPGDL